MFHKMHKLRHFEKSVLKVLQGPRQNVQVSSKKYIGWSFGSIPSLIELYKKAKLAQSGTNKFIIRYVLMSTCS